MLSDKDFLAFLNDKSLDKVSKEQLEKIIDEEIEKTEEMNTELIEYCLDKLNELESGVQNADETTGNGDSNNKRVKKFKFKKIIAIAAAVSILLAGMSSVSAVVFNKTVYDGIVELYNDYIRINFDKTDDKSDTHKLLNTELAKELAENGFGDVLLPEAFFSDEYEITDVSYEFTEVVISADIHFKYNGKKGCIFLTKYAMDEIVPDIECLNVTSNIEKIEIGNTTTFCYMQDKVASIDYRDSLTLYSIKIPTDLDSAIEFAKTIK